MAMNSACLVGAPNPARRFQALSEILDCGGAHASVKLMITDPSNLSDAGKALFDDTKMTAHGLEVKLADRVGRA